MKKILVLALAVVMTLGLIAACAPQAANDPTPAAPAAPAAPAPEAPAPAPQGNDGPLKIGFANLIDAGDYMAWVKRGMEEAAAAHGVELISVDNEADGTVAIRNADTLIAAGVDAVIWYMNDAAVNSQAKDMFDAAGIPVVAVDIIVSNAAGTAPQIGGDNYKAGHIAGTGLGEYVMEHWGPDIDLYICNGTLSNAETNDQRNGGMRDGVRDAGVNLTDDLIVVIDGDDNMMESQRLVTDVLTANPDKKRILIANHQDDMTQGAFAAVEIAGRQDDVLIVGNGPFGSTFENMRRAERNFWVGSASFAPEQYGPIGIDLAIRLARGETVPQENFVQHVFLTHYNINDYYPPN